MLPVLLLWFQFIEFLMQMKLTCCAYDGIPGEHGVKMLVDIVQIKHV